jgi:orotidine-5'-phosphate decarboxylase
MGKDSILPFLEYLNKWSFVLSLTSNKGAEDFELQMLDSGMPLYRKVIEKSLEWSRNQKGILGFVAGATRIEQIEEIYRASESSYLLVPGIGAQGGDLDLLLQSVLAKDKKAIITVSRSVIYASQGEDFAEMAQNEAIKLQSAISSLIF